MSNEGIPKSLSFAVPEIQAVEGARKVRIFLRNFFMLKNSNFFKKISILVVNFFLNNGCSYEKNKIYYEYLN